MVSGFHHEAIFYGTDGEYLAGLLPDLHAATTALVAVSEEKANHLCDLVQLRSSPAGTVVRLHMSLDRAG